MLQINDNNTEIIKFGIDAPFSFPDIFNSFDFVAFFMEILEDTKWKPNINTIMSSIHNLHLLVHRIYNDDDTIGIEEIQQEYKRYIFKDNGRKFLVLGFACLSFDVIKNLKLCKIHIFDTFVRGHNCGKILINKLNDKYDDNNLIIIDPLPESIDYWIKNYYNIWPCFGLYDISDYINSINNILDPSIYRISYNNIFDYPIYNKCVEMFLYYYCHWNFECIDKIIASYNFTFGDFSDDEKHLLIYGSNNKRFFPLPQIFDKQKEYSYEACEWRLYKNMTTHDMLEIINLLNKYLNCKCELLARYEGGLELFNNDEIKQITFRGLKWPLVNSSTIKEWESSDPKTLINVNENNGEIFKINFWYNFNNYDKYIIVYVISYVLQDYDAGIKNRIEHYKSKLS